MKKYLASYASPGYYENQEFLEASALSHGFDAIYNYRREDIVRHEFYKRNKKILDVTIANGCFLWKPFVIYESLTRMEEGDILVYCDTDMYITGPFDPLFDICTQQQGIMLFGGDTQNNRMANKRDTFTIMGCDNETYWNAWHPWGGFNLWMKNEKNLSFVSEWLTYCCDERIIRDMPNVCGLPNFPEFCTHAHDESVLSILAVKHDIEIFRAPHPRTNYGKMKRFRVPGESLGTPQDPPMYTPYMYRDYDEDAFPNSPYPNLLDSHHKPNNLMVTTHEALLHGIRYHKDGFPDDIHSARRVYEAVLGVAPDCVEAYYLLGVAHYQLNNLELAERIFSVVLSKRPCFVEAWYCLYLLFLAQGNIENSKACIKAISELDASFLDKKADIKEMLDIPCFRKHSIRLNYRGILS